MRLAGRVGSRSGRLQPEPGRGKKTALLLLRSQPPRCGPRGVGEGVCRSQNGALRRAATSTRILPESLKANTTAR